MVSGGGGEWWGRIDWRMSESVFARTEERMALVKTATGVSAAIGAGGGTLALRQIVGIGLNYAAHAAEQNKPAPTRPVLFTKNPRAACLHGDRIVVPKVCQDRPQVDFEAELAVVLGVAPRGVGAGDEVTPTMAREFGGLGEAGGAVGGASGVAGGGASGARLIRDVPVADALRCVLGYCVANDVSARWWQKEGSGGQFYRGKSFDTFCPLGPWITPAHRVPDPQRLAISARLNGVEMQRSTTADMIFPVAQLIAEMSRGTTILPGTVILTGTPSGVGFARNPPVFMARGDTIEVEVEGLGVLRNVVEEE